VQIARGSQFCGSLLAGLCALSACHGYKPEASLDNAAIAAADVPALLAELRQQMVDIPAGHFEMGNDLGHADDELPVHRVDVRRFQLSRHEVTGRQFAVFARATGRTRGAAAAEESDHPATNISWDDAVAFIAWVNGSGVQQYRLPTEAEWEYAARAGTATRFWWGDEFQAGYVNGAGVSGNDRWAETAPVGSFPANPFGLHDILGNVWEWTADCYTPNYERAQPDGSAARGEQDCGRVLRGGSWSDTPLWLRSATRNWFDRGERFDYVGFRLASDEPLSE
jgi:formylglycine-generating enzyme required for sulfatase activity